MGVDGVVGEEKADGGVHDGQQHAVAPEGGGRQAALLVVALRRPTLEPPDHMGVLGFRV